MAQVTPSSNRIAFIGDLHGNRAAFEYTAAAAFERGCTTIIQVGDFWMFNSKRGIVRMQRALRRACPSYLDNRQIDYRFIDGNHENFDLLDPDANEPVQVSDNVTYMPRGSRGSFAGAELMFFGGASSVDRFDEHDRLARTTGKDWWPAENITHSQVDRALATTTASSVASVDILVSHETTTDAFLALSAERARQQVPQLDIDDLEGDRNRWFLAQIAHVLEPQLQVHGHHHTPFAGIFGGVHDLGLGCEIQVGAMAILDTSDWRWTVPASRKDTGEDVDFPMVS